MAGAVGVERRRWPWPGRGGGTQSGARRGRGGRRVRVERLQLCKPRQNRQKAQEQPQNVMVAERCHPACPQRRSTYLPGLPVPPARTWPPGEPSGMETPLGTVTRPGLAAVGDTGGVGTLTGDTRNTGNPPGARPGTWGDLLSRNPSLALPRGARSWREPFPATASSGAGAGHAHCAGPRPLRGVPPRPPAREASSPPTGGAAARRRRSGKSRAAAEAAEGRRGGARRWRSRSSSCGRTACTRRCCGRAPGRCPTSATAPRSEPRRCLRDRGGVGGGGGQRRDGRCAHARRPPF